MPTHKKNTLMQAATSNAETKACKRVFFSPTQEEIQIIFPSLRFFNYLFFQRTVHNRTETASNVNRFEQSVCNLDTTHFWTERRASGNKVLPKAGVTNFYDTLVLNRTLVFQMNGSAETPRLRQYPNRKQQPIGRHHFHKHDFNNFSY